MINKYEIFFVTLRCKLVEKLFGIGGEGKRIEVECEKCNFCNLHFWGRLMGIRVGRIGQVYDDWRKMACLYKDEKIKF